MEVVHFLNLSYRYAIVGASANPDKYGHVVFFDLLNAGFKVIPVNPNITNLEGIHAVASLTEILPPPEVAVLIVPPAIGLTLLKEGARHGIKKFWFQPGAESTQIRSAAKRLKVEAIADGSCIMVARRIYWRAR